MTATGARCTILLVEDNRADVFLIQEAIQSAHINAELQIMQDGEKAIQYFERLDSDDTLQCPAMMILDINLPKRPGNEVLAFMRRSRRCVNTTVLVTTSSDSERDRDEMAKLGVRDYFRKPSDFESFMKLGDIVKGLLQPRP